MTKIPCKNCICVPICKNKPYMNLIVDCELIRYALYKYERLRVPNRKPYFRKILKQTEETLKPTVWNIKSDDVSIEQKSQNNPSDPVIYYVPHYFI